MTGSWRTACGMSVSGRSISLRPPLCRPLRAVLLFIEAVKARFKPDPLPSKAMAMGTAENGAATWKSDLVLALLAALLGFAFNAWAGFGQLTDAGGDNDNLLRLVEVRDLLAGQGWFDLHQYRMGLE